MPQVSTGSKAPIQDMGGFEVQWYCECFRSGTSTMPGRLFSFIMIGQLAVLDSGSERERHLSRNPRSILNLFVETVPYDHERVLLVVNSVHQAESGPPISLNYRRERVRDEVFITSLTRSSFLLSTLYLKRIILLGNLYCYPTNYQNQSEVQYCSYPILSFSSHLLSFSFSFLVYPILSFSSSLVYPILTSSFSSLVYPILFFSFSSLVYPILSFSFSSLVCPILSLSFSTLVYPILTF